MSMFGLKINKEAFQARADADISHYEQALLNESLSSSRLANYLEARATKEFFQGILNAYRNPSIDFVDFVEYHTKPYPANPLNRSTSTMQNIFDDLEQHLKSEVYSIIIRLREVQAEREAEAAAAEESSK